MEDAIIKNDTHKAIIDEYFANGFNKTQAVIKVKAAQGVDVGYMVAGNIGQLVFKSAKNQDYIAHKRMMLSSDNDVRASEIVNELKGIAFADVTNYIGLTHDEVKALPPLARRALKKITVRTKTIPQKGAKPIKEVETTYELNDKLKAIESIAKHIGFYSEHNAQKQPTIDLTKATPDELNAVLSIISKQQEANNMISNK